ncbi:hypothetical protein G9A89_019125 [Geosiphon pyriformis]|nr:hypothetical protein G9A89_019125 [Geosiphon pyriformis]
MERAFEHQVTGTPVNTELAREIFYRELIQNTNLPTNHNFASIITEINKEIEHHTQQRYLITYTNKGKEKLQTPAVTPRKIQPSTWKKNRIESPSNSSYHYTPRSAINISSTDASSSTVILAFGRFPFQNFGISDPWKVTESEKEEEKSEDQEFTYQHLITENLEQNLNLENSEIETPNHQRQNNPNPELINQQNLPLIAATPTTTPTTNPMTYAPIVKLDNFTSEEDDTQYQSLINKPQDFNAFKVEFLRYFSNNNSINCLVNIFTTMKQEETEAVTTYLGCFHQNLHQIQAIDANYFTAPQILNQFIHSLCNSILQHVHPLHPGTLQDAVTHTRDFESAESKANHVQAINLVINRSFELDSKLENLHNDAIIKETLIIPKINHVHLYWPINILNFELSIKLNTISNHLSTNNVATNLSITGISTSSLSKPNNLFTNHSKLEINNSCPLTDLQFLSSTSWITHSEFGYWSHPKPKFPKLFKSSGYPRRRHFQQFRNQLTSNVTTADNIQKSQEKQKERHNSQLLDKPVEFKIGDKVLLHHTKVEKQWNGPFHIEEILGNGAYKLRQDNKILTKAAHED